MRLRVRKGLMVSGAGAEDAWSAGLRAAADIWGFAAPYDRAFGLSLRRWSLQGLYIAAVELLSL